MCNLVNWFEKFMFDAHIFDNRLNHQVRFFDHTGQIGWSIQTFQHAVDEFILLFAIIFELLFRHTTQTVFYTILCLFHQLIIDFNDCDIVACRCCNLRQFFRVKNFENFKTFVFLRKWTMDSALSQQIRQSIRRCVFDFLGKQRHKQMQTDRKIHLLVQFQSPSNHHQLR